MEASPQNPGRLAQYLMNRSARRRKESPVAGVTLQYLGGRPVRSAVDVDSYAREGYAENPDVRAAIDILATAVAGVRWRSEKYVDGEWVDAGDTPILRLWSRPNPRMSRAELVAGLVRWRRIAGESFIGSAGPENRAPLELWLLHPGRMELIPSGDTSAPVKRWDYKLAGRTQPLDPATVLHLPMFNPENELRGLSPLESVARLIDQAAAAYDWNLGALQNGGIPPGFLMTDEPLTDEQFDHLQSQVRGEWMNSRNAGVPQLLEAGMQWKDAARTPAEMQFLDAQKMFALKFAQVIGVPSEFLAGAGEKKYSNYAEARKALYTEAALPELDLIMGELNTWLMPLFNDGVRLAYDVDDIEALQEQRETVHKRANDAYRAGVATRNEARAMIGLEAVEGGDEFADSPEFDPMLDGAPPTPAAKSTSLDDDSGGDLGKAFRVDLWKRVDARRGKMEKVARRMVDEQLKRDVDAVVKAINAGNVEGAADRVSAAMLDQRDEWAILYPKLYETVGKPFAEGTLRRVQATAGPMRGKAVGWQTLLSQWLAKDVESRIKGVTNTMRDQVHADLDAGIREGESIDNLAKRVAAHQLDEIIPNRSRVIARTETISASNAASVSAAKSTGLEMRKVWVATSDERTRAAHDDADGQTVGLEDDFDIDGEAMEFPGDWDGGSAENTIQCRCTVTYEVAD